MLQDTIETYYELVDKRVPGHGEDLERLKRNRILIDGDTGEDEGILLQIFTEPMIGPIFFEIIQRKGNEGLRQRQLPGAVRVDRAGSDPPGCHHGRRVSVGRMRTRLRPTSTGRQRAKPRPRNERLCRVRRPGV